MPESNWSGDGFIQMILYAISDWIYPHYHTLLCITLRWYEPYLKHPRELFPVERVYGFNCGWRLLSWICPSLDEDAYDIVVTDP